MKNDVLTKLIAWGIEVQHHSLPVKTDQIVPGCLFSLTDGHADECPLVLQASRLDGPVGLPTEQEALQGAQYSFGEELKGFEGIVGYTTNANFVDVPAGSPSPEASYVRYSLFATLDDSDYTA